MKNRQSRIIILILVGLVLFSSSLALLMYSKQTKSQENIDTTVTVYAASKRLNRGDLIRAKDVTKIRLSKSYLAFTPLTQSEIVGRYASVDIFVKEPFRKEKISISKPLKENVLSAVAVQESKPKIEEISQSNFDAISVPLSLFRNIDYSLKQGDYIDIVSIFSKKVKNSETEFKTKYIALRIEIDSFANKQRSMKTFTIKGEKDTLITADSVVLKMDPDNVKNFLAVYYRAQEINSNRVHNVKKDNSGHLWMIKCSDEIDVKAQTIKERMLADHIVVPKRKKRAPKGVSISYEN